jgi:hypothetical protein
MSDSFSGKWGRREGDWADILISQKPVLNLFTNNIKQNLFELSIFFPYEKTRSKHLSSLSAPII